MGCLAARSASRPVGPVIRALALSVGLLAPAALCGPGCVMSYGEATGVRPAEPLPPPNDFTEVQARLEQMEAGETRVDRRDRLDAALDLLRVGRTMDPDPQARVLRYLQRLVTIEERSQPVDAPSLFTETLPETTATFAPITGGIEEEDLGGAEEVPAAAAPAAESPAEEASAAAAAAPAAVSPAESTEAPTEASTEAPTEAPTEASTEASTEAPTEELQVAEPMSLARAALDAGDPAGALAALEPCGVVDCPDGVATLRAQAQIAWIHAERERAGALFVRARSEPDPTERKARLVESRQILSALLDRFPDAPQAEDIRRNVDLVDKEIATLH